MNISSTSSSSSSSLSSESVLNRSFCNCWSVGFGVVGAAGVELVVFIVLVVAAG